MRRRSKIGGKMEVRDYYKYEIVQFRDSTNVLIRLENGTVIPVKQIGQTDLYIFFETRGLKAFEFPSEFKKVREYAEQVMKTAPAAFKKSKLLEQQICELIANSVKHGNKRDVNKTVKVWVDFIKGEPSHNLANKIRVIVEDEGDGFAELQEWNKFLINRTICLTLQDYNNLPDLLMWQGKDFDELSGGNALFAAVEYWNGGIYFTERANKCVTLRYFSNEE